MWQQRQHSAVRAKLEIRILGRISTAVDDAVISTCSQVKVESDTVLAVLKDRHEWELRDLQTKLEDALRAFSVLGPYDLSGCRGGVSQLGACSASGLPSSSCLLFGVGTVSHDAGGYLPPSNSTSSFMMSEPIDYSFSSGEWNPSTGGWGAASEL